MRNANKSVDQIQCCTTEMKKFPTCVVIDKSCFTICCMFSKTIASVSYLPHETAKYCYRILDALENV